jgi:hypothetical protein
VIDKSKKEGIIGHWSMPFIGLTVNQHTNTWADAIKRIFLFSTRVSFLPLRFSFLLLNKYFGTRFLNFFCLGKNFEMCFPNFFQI